MGSWKLLIALREISVEPVGLRTGLASGDGKAPAGMADCSVCGPFRSPKECLRFCWTLRDGAVPCRLSWPLPLGDRVGLANPEARVGSIRAPTKGPMPSFCYGCA